MGEQAAKCGLYLVLGAGDGASERLAAALAAASAAAVLIRPAPSPIPSQIDAIRTLIGAAQARGCAALILDDARLARTLGADGVHLTWSRDIADRFAEARDILGNRAIVGAGAGSSRHDAMQLGEAGAEYVGFGAVDAEPDAENRLELVDWWAEIFEVPCVAFGVTTIDDAGALAQAGADFVGLHLRAGASLPETRDLVAGVAAALVREAAA